MRARQLIESLTEGTVIVINGGGNGQDDMPDPQTVVQELEKARSAASKQHVNINGKRWHFTVNRNEQGQIESLDVEQS